MRYENCADFEGFRCDHLHGSIVGLEEGLELGGKLDETVTCVVGDVVEGNGPIVLAGHVGH